MKKLNNLLPKLEITLLYEQDLSTIPNVEAGGPCVIKRILLDSLGYFSQIRPMEPRKLEQFRRRFERGDHCYMAEMEGKAVHYSWVQMKEEHYIQSAGRSYHIRKGEFWIYDCFTAEWARGLHIYPFVLTHILKGFQHDKMFFKAFIYTTQSNRASHRGIEGVGFSLNRKLIAISVKDKVISLPAFL